MSTSEEIDTVTVIEAPAAPRKAPAKRRKGAAKAPAKAAKAQKAAPKARKARQLDPAKLDAFGFRKGSAKSKAATMYASVNGATLRQVKEKLGSVQFNVLTEIKNKGFKIIETQVKGPGRRTLTRYKAVTK